MGPFSFLLSALFRPISARSFHAMRMAWAAVTLWFLVLQWQDLPWLLSDAGMLPRSLFSSLHLPLLARWSLLQGVGHPWAVYAFAFLLVLSLLGVLLGFHARLLMVVSWLLSVSFHQRNPLLLGGGDLLLQSIGFLLLLAPLPNQSCSSSLSAEKEGSCWTMPAWPSSLLVWQIVLVYTTSAWQKLLGGPWWEGRALALALQHPHFARWPGLFSPGILELLSPVLGFSIIAFELAWLLLLLPSERFHRFSLRLLLSLGVVFHVLIALLLKVGSFSPAMFVAYLGLVGSLTPASTPQGTPQAQQSFTLRRSAATCGSKGEGCPDPSTGSGSLVEECKDVRRVSHTREGSTGAPAELARPGDRSGCAVTSLTSRYWRGQGGPWSFMPQSVGRSLGAQTACPGHT